MKFKSIAISILVSAAGDVSLSSAQNFRGACPSPYLDVREANGSVAAVLDHRVNRYISYVTGGKRARIEYYYCSEGYFRAQIRESSDGNDCKYDAPIVYQQTIEAGRRVYGRIDKGGQSCGNGFYVFSGKFY